MAAVSRPGSWWGAVSAVLVATGASLLIGGALLANHVTLEVKFAPPWLDPYVTTRLVARSTLVLLVGAGVLVAAAWRPDRWAPWLTRLGAPAARVFLPLTLAFLSLPLGLTTVWLYDSAPARADVLAVAGRVLALTLALGLPGFLLARRTDLFRALSRVALPLSGCLLLVGGAIALQDSLTGQPVDSLASHRQFLDLFGPARTLIEPLDAEGAAGRGDTSPADPVLDPGMIDTMVERHVRGAGERPVERSAPRAPFVPRSVDISLSGHPMTLDLRCDHFDSEGDCRAVRARVEGSPGWKTRPSFLLDPRVPTEVRQARNSDQLLFSNGNALALFNPADGVLEGIDLDSRQVRLRQQQPLPWRLAPLVALAAVLLLWVRRGAVTTWREALRQGVPVRVRDGWVHGPDGFEAATELRDGPALLVEEVPRAAGYREASTLPTGVLVPGRQQALVDRAQLNVQLLDATALLVTSLLVAPGLAVALAQIALSFGR